MEPQSSSQPKLYILVRNDIPVPDQMAQACHAAEVHGITYANKPWPWGKRHGLTTTVVVSVPSAQQLEVWYRKINQACLDHIEFCEPDMNNQVTAIACRTDSNIFSGLPLWVGEPAGDPVFKL